MRDFQHGPVGALRPGQILPLDRPVPSEKVRLDALRLECLKLAQTMDDVVCLAGESPTDRCIAAASAMFDYVTDAPKRPDLFAVKRMDADAPPDDLGPREYLNISGSLVSWGFADHAYRFRSKAEAEAAIALRVDGVGDFYGLGIGGIGVVVPLPAHFDIF